MNKNVILAISIIVIWFMFLIIYTLVEKYKNKKLDKLDYEISVFVFNYESLLKETKDKSIPSYILDDGWRELTEHFKQVYDNINDCCDIYKHELTDITNEKIVIDYKEIKKHKITLKVMKLTNVALCTFIAYLVEHNIIDLKNKEISLNDFQNDGGIKI